jgi:hypothetical protein
MAQAPAMSLAQSLFAGGENYKDNRPPCRIVHLMQKDSKNIFAVDFKTPSCRMYKGRF